MTRSTTAERSRLSAAPPPSSLLDTAQAADYLGVTPRFIRTLVQERRIVHHKLGRFVRFTSTDLDAFVQSGRVEVWHQ